MHGSIFQWALLVLVLTIGSPQARADKRVALVVGNGNYQHVPKLAAPTKDAATIGAALKQVGFDSVRVLENLDRARLEQSLNELKTAASGAEIALVYFSGYAGATDSAGQNFVMPVDARGASPRDVALEALPLDLFRQATAPATKLKMVVLDSAWEPPFLGKRMQEHRGLAPVEGSFQQGEVIALSTRAGTVTGSAAAESTQYAAAFVRNLAARELDVKQFLAKVRDDVSRITDFAQEPSVYAATWHEPVLFGPPPPARPAPPVPAPAVASAQPPQAKAPPAPPAKGAEPPKSTIPAPLSPTDAAQAWSATKDTTSIAVLETFAMAVRSSIYEHMARARIEELRALRGDKDATTTAASSRIEARPPEPAAPQPPAPPPPPSQATAAPDPQPPPPPPLSSDANFVRALQTELKRLGCDPGAIDGVWGAKVQTALAEFVRRTELNVPSADPTRAHLEAAVARQGSVCPLQCSAGQIEQNGACIAIAPPQAAQPKQKTTVPPKKVFENPKQKTSGADNLPPCAGTPPANGQYCRHANGSKCMFVSGMGRVCQ